LIYTQLQGTNKQPSRFGMDKYNFYNHCISNLITDVDWDGDIWRASPLSLSQNAFYTSLNVSLIIKKTQTKAKIKKRLKKNEKYVVSPFRCHAPDSRSDTPSPTHKSWTRDWSLWYVFVIADCQLKMSNDTTYCINNSFFICEKMTAFHSNTT
jgi:hypothetical protein